MRGGWESSTKHKDHIYGWTALQFRSILSSGFLNLCDKYHIQESSALLVHFLVEFRRCFSLYSQRDSRFRWNKILSAFLWPLQDNMCVSVERNSKPLFSRRSGSRSCESITQTSFLPSPTTKENSLCVQARMWTTRICIKKAFSCHVKEKGIPGGSQSTLSILVDMTRHR